MDILCTNDTNYDNFLIETYWDQPDNEHLFGEIIIKDGHISTQGEIDNNSHGCGGMTTYMYCSEYETLSGDLEFDESNNPYSNLTIDHIKRDSEGNIIEDHKSHVELKFDHKDENGSIILSGKNEEGKTFYLKVNKHCCSPSNS